MSYTVDLELDHLPCRSRAAAHQAAALINSDPWMRRHLEVSAVSRSSPERDDSWALVVETYDGCTWHEPAARRIWLAIAPLMANGSILEFREEGGRRFRILWEAGRAHEEFPAKVIWAARCSWVATSVPSAGKYAKISPHLTPLPGCRPLGIHM